MATTSSSSPLSSLLLVLGLGLRHVAAQVAFVNATDHLGCVHMPIIHSTNTQFFPKRAIEVQLANRTDVAYYAQRICSQCFISMSK